MSARQYAIATPSREEFYKMIAKQRQKKQKRSIFRRIWKFTSRTLLVWGGIIFMISIVAFLVLRIMKFEEFSDMAWDVVVYSFIAMITGLVISPRDDEFTPEEQAMFEEWERMSKENLERSLNASFAPWAYPTTIGYLFADDD